MYSRKVERDLPVKKVLYTHYTLAAKPVYTYKVGFIEYTVSHLKLRSI